MSAYLRPDFWHEARKGLAERERQKPVSEDDGKENEVIGMSLTPWPICPHCRERQQDDMEAGQYQECECTACGKNYKRFREIEISYTTEAME